MKISTLCLTAFVGTAAAFSFTSVNTPTFGGIISERSITSTSSRSSSTSSTCLQIGKTGFLEPDTAEWQYTRRDRRSDSTINQMENANVFNPEDELERYIDEPEPVPARPNIDGTVLVSGWVRSKERSDQTVFDMLNSEESAFQFEKIVAFVDDVKFAKKRLLSRSARYNGLLDKLDMSQASEPGALPTVEVLQGVKCWVAHVEVDAENPGAALQELKDIAAVAGEAGCVENVSVLMSGASAVTDVSATVEAIQALDAVQNMAFTVVAVGDLDEKEEGSRAYEVKDFGTEEGVVPEGAVYSRAESVRVITECLALESGIDKALTFTELTGNQINNCTAATLVKGLRQAGYTRPQEINHMIVSGVKEYDDLVAKYYKMLDEIENPSEEVLAARKAKQEEDQRRQHEELKAKIAKERVEETEAMAREYAQKEYFHACMAGTVLDTEEEFRKSIWDKAMAEADKKYRIIHRLDTEGIFELTDQEKENKRIEDANKLRARKALSTSMKDFMDNDEDDEDDEDDENDDDDDDDDV